MVEENELKTWPATPVRSVVLINLRSAVDLVGMLPVEAGGSRGRSAIQYCQLVIAAKTIAED